jgi:hypothetical protein
MGINYGLYVSLLEGDGIPLALLYHINVAFASWVCQCINTPQLANVAFDTTLATNTSLVALWSLKQTTQYRKYCIWNLKLRIQIKLSMLEFSSHESFLIHGKNANLLTLHHLIRCRFFVSFHPNAFEHLCILDSNRSNHNCKVPIALHLGLHVEKDRPHTPCNHAKKLKNMDKS